MNKDSALYKPIQYLGAKTRTLDIIVSESKRLYHENSYIIDLFSGSGIVSQALYNNGMSVLANDVMGFCTDMSSCLLNVSKTKVSSKIIRDVIKSIRDFAINRDFIIPFKDYMDEEARLLQAEDLLGLKNLYMQLPQVGNEKSSQSTQIKYILNNLGCEAYDNVPLIANYYAGTYFGITQSIRLDAIRSNIEKIYNENHDMWAYTTMLTALYSTLSIIVHSAGKHFAQPILINNLDKEKIKNKRLFENRKYDVDKLYIDFLNEIVTKTEKGIIPSNNISLCYDIQDKAFEKQLNGLQISHIYADPPYTAQQYSRFYHIPEVVKDYRYPQLQLFRGHITQGLYPNNKFKSDFCSKTKAKDAFKTIFSIAKKKDCNLIISYSESQKNETGNERMVTRSDILSIAKEFLPTTKVKQIGLEFEYRQLNSSSKVVQNKEDKEFLIIFEKK